MIRARAACKTTFRSGQMLFIYTRFNSSSIGIVQINYRFQTLLNFTLPPLYPFLRTGIYITFTGKNV